MNEIMNRLPPQSIEAESALLGSIMMFPEVFDDIAGIVGQDDFYREEHKRIFTAFSEIGKNIDLLTVVQYLKDNNELDVVGGPAYLASICDQIPSASRAKKYAKIVKEKAQIRSFIMTGSELIQQCFDGGEFNALISTLESEVMKLSEKNNRGSGAKSLRDIVNKSFKQIENISSGDVGSGITTGFDDLDSILVGLQPADLIILAGRPSMGKTALAMSIIKRVGYNQIPSGVFSLEMSDMQLGTRMISDESRVNSITLRSGHIVEASWPKLTRAVGTLSELPIFIDDTPALSIDELRSRARIMKRKHDIQFVVIDYLQLMTGNEQSREREISKISSGLKSMAKELGIPVMALSQLNRSLESRSDKRPMLSDLRESGAIEQDADVVMFVYRDEVYNKNTPKEGIAEVIVGKQRNGPTGIAELQWNKHTTSFNDLAR